MLITEIKTAENKNNLIHYIQHSFNIEVENPIAPCGPINTHTVVMEWYSQENYGVVYSFCEHSEVNEEEEFENFEEAEKAAIKLINQIRDQEIEFNG